MATRGKYHHNAEKISHQKIAGEDETERAIRENLALQKWKMK